MPKHTKRVKREEGPPEGETLVAQSIRFLDAVEREIQEGHEQAWKAVLERFALMADELITGRARVSGNEGASQRFDDSDEMQLEQVYQDLQTQLIQVRQAVAQAIATQHQIEQQLQKNKDQAETWLERATMAEQQNKHDLGDQARQRMAQYAKSASQLDQQLIQQRKDVLVMRQKLTDFEGKVQEAYVQKQVLLARNKAAQATMVANQIIDQINADDALSELKRLEQKVVEREEQAAKGALASGVAKPLDHSKTLTDAVTTLQLTIDAVARLEQLIAKRESKK